MTAVLRWAAGWRYVLALAGTAAAFLVAIIVSAGTDRLWQTDVDVVVGTGSGPLRPGSDGATRELAERLDDLVRSHQIAGNVVSTLHLHKTPDALLDRISAAVPGPGLLRIGVRDEVAVRATQIAQEIAFLFPQLLSHRFPRLRAVVWDPPHLVGRTSSHWGRNLGIAAGIAVALWAAAIAVGARGRPRRAVPVGPARAVPAATAVPAQPAGARVPTVPRPPPSPPPAVPEAVAPPPAARAEDPPLAPSEPAAPEPPAVAVPAPPSATPEAATGPSGQWTLADVEHAVAAYGADFPGRVDEWGFYIESMRQFADGDGRLPATLDWLVWDTFGDILERARSEPSPHAASETSPTRG